MRGIGVEFLKFGVVGAIGFVFDTATVYGLRSSVGIYAAGFLAYGVAATVTWGLNRVWTFRGRGAGPAHRQWATFLAANGLRAAPCGNIGVPVLDAVRDPGGFDVLVVEET